jgi:mycothiol synthase
MVDEDGRSFVLAEERGTLVGHGVAAPSSLADGFVAPRVLPEHRGRGIGSELLEALLELHRSLGRTSIAAHADNDTALRFAARHGFVEIDQQVEQVRDVHPDEPEPPAYPGVTFTSVADRPDLQQGAWSVAEQGYADMKLVTGPAHVTLEEWLREDATLPGGSIIGLADGRIVGWAGLMAWNDDDHRAENGLTAVDRGWRRRGLAAAMKRHQLRWAAENGIREIVTWTQQGNEAMQHVNLGLGYVTRSISHVVRRDAI